MTGKVKWVILTYGLLKENCLQKLFFNKFIEMSCRQETIVSVETNHKLEPSFFATAICISFIQFLGGLRVHSNVLIGIVVLAIYLVRL